MNIQVIDSMEDFERLRDSWDRLLHQSVRATVFNSWEWQYYWWKHYGNDHQLRILVATIDNEVIGIAPFYLRHIRPLGLFPMKILQLIATGGDTSPDYLDLLCTPEHEAEISKRLASYILTQWAEWDAIDWTDMPEASPLYGELAGQGKTDFCIEQGAGSRISQLELSASWEQFLKNLPHKKRYKVRRRYQNIVNDIKGRFFVWQDSSTLDQALEILIRLHHDRWKNRARRFAFSSPAYIEFHRDIIHAFHARDWLRLYCLATEDKVIAMEYCYQFKGAVLQFQGGFDSKYYNLSPGFVLMCCCFKKAIEEGNSLFDFLKGEYAYKKEFETCFITTRYLRCYRKTRPAQNYRLLKRAKKRLRSEWHLLKRIRIRCRGG